MKTQTDRRTLVVQPLPDCDPEIGRVLWMLEDARRRTLAELEDLTPQALERTAPGSPNTIGALLYHTAAIEASWLYEEALQTEPPAEIDALFPEDVRDEQGLLSATAGMPLSEHLQRLARVRAALLAAYRSMTLEEFHRAKKLELYDVTPEWVLHHLMQHEAEHRGQIGALK